MYEDLKKRVEHVYYDGIDLGTPEEINKVIHMALKNYKVLDSELRIYEKDNAKLSDFIVENYKECIHIKEYGRSISNSACEIAMNIVKQKEKKIKELKEMLNTHYGKTEEIYNKCLKI